MTPELGGRIGLTVSLGEATNALHCSMEQFLFEEIPAYFDKKNRLNRETSVEIARIFNTQNQRVFQPKFWLPSPPSAIAFRVTTGVGKSHVARNLFARQLEVRGGPVVVFVPTHELADEQARSFSALNSGYSSGVFRGMTQPDLTDSEFRMCRVGEEAARVVSFGIPLKSVCGGTEKSCPHHPKYGADTPCSYLGQLEQTFDIWYVPVNYAFRPPAGFPTPTLVVFEESFWQAGLEGFDEFRPIRFSVPTLAGSKCGEKVLKAIQSMESGWLHRQDLVEAMLTPEECISEATLIQEELWALSVEPGMSANELTALAQRLEQRPLNRLLMFWRAIGELLNGLEKNTPKIVLKRNVSLPRGEGKADFIYLYDYNLIDGKFWLVPKIVLDGTLPELLVQPHNMPKLTVHHIDVETPNVYVRQITDKLLSASMMIPDAMASERKNKERWRNVIRLKDYLLVQTTRLRRRAVTVDDKAVCIVVVCQKELEVALHQLGLPEGVATAHFNAMAGLDKFRKIPKIVIVGRMEPRPTDIAHMATVIKSICRETIGSGEWYPTSPRRLDPKSSPSIYDIPNSSHPDPLTDEIREQICEAQLIQAIGRPRGVRRTADNPLEVDILTNVVLPIEVDREVIWKHVVPDAFEAEFALNGVLALTKGEMARLHPHRWKTPDAAKYALKQAGGRDALLERFGGVIRLLVLLYTAVRLTERCWL